MARLKQEVIRFFALKKNYGFDTILETVEDFIFLYGILAVSAFVGKGVEAFFFSLWYIGWTILNEGIDELENEIRSDQFEGLKTTTTSLFSVYLGRTAAYGLYGVLRLILFLTIFNPRLLISLKNVLMTPQGFMMFLFHLLLTLLLFEVLVSLTIRFERVSTMVNLMYTLSIFISGLVTPLNQTWTYRFWLEKASSSFLGVVVLSLIGLLLGITFVFLRKTALKKLNGAYGN